MRVPFNSQPTMPSNKKYTFGIQKPCTPEQLKEETKELYSKCFLKDVGTFYFTYGGPNQGKKGWFLVFLHFYDEERQVLHTSSQNCMIATRELRPSFSVDICTFLVGYPENPAILVMARDWKTSKFKRVREGRRVLVEALVGESSLSKIREGTSGDFQLKSIDGSCIKVHTTVVAPLWSFFATALESNMKEAVNKTMKIQTTASTLEVIVRYFYEQDLKMTLQDAANLIVAAKMYILPELLEIATDFIQKQDLSAQEALTVWEKCKEANNDDLRHYCASKMKTKMPGVTQSRERIAKMTKPDILKLFMDISQSFEEDASKKRKSTDD